MTVTWVSVTSGSASTGNCLNATMPPPMNSISASIDEKRLRERERDDAPIPRRALGSFLDAPRLQHLLQHQHVFGRRRVDRPAARR